MFVECNAMTGQTVSTEAGNAARDLADALEALPSEVIQIAAQRLGYQKTASVVSEMLYALLPEEAVAVAMEQLQAEYAAQTAARSVALQGEPFLED